MDNLPVFANGAAIGLIRGVSMSDAPGIHDLTIASGAIAAIRPSRMQHAQWLVLPGMSNMHAHADRSFDSADGSGRTFPETDADPLESAFLADIAAQLDDMRAVLKGITGGRNELSPGSIADLVLICAESFLDALARRARQDSAASRQRSRGSCKARRHA